MIQQKERDGVKNGIPMCVWCKSILVLTNGGSNGAPDTTMCPHCDLPCLRARCDKCDMMRPGADAGPTPGSHGAGSP